MHNQQKKTQISLKNDKIVEKIKQKTKFFFKLYYHDISV